MIVTKGESSNPSEATKISLMGQHHRGDHMMPRVIACQIWILSCSIQHDQVISIISQLNFIRFYNFKNIYVEFNKFNGVIMDILEFCVWLYQNGDIPK
jgi:hypothetical protein